MNFMKLIILVIVSISLIACGSDSTNNSPTNGDVAPVNDGLGDDPTSDDTTDDNGGNTGGDQPGFNQVFQVNAKKTSSFNVDKNWNCSQPVQGGKLSHQERAKIFNRLCRRASKMSFNQISQKCNHLNGVVFQDPTYDSNTSRTTEGHCRIFHCEVRATGPCGVN